MVFNLCRHIQQKTELYYDPGRQFDSDYCMKWILFLFAFSFKELFCQMKKKESLCKHIGKYVFFLEHWGC